MEKAKTRQGWTGGASPANGDGEDCPQIVLLLLRLLMASFRLLLFLFFLLQSDRILRRSAAGPVAVELVYPNFTASNLHFIDSSGVFLESPAGVFHAVIDSPLPQQPGNFYFSVVHVLSHSIVWTANVGAPVSNSGELALSPAGLSLSADGGAAVWATPRLSGAVLAMRLADTGNLMLLGRGNSTLWQSFDHPTDTFVSGQDLGVGGAGLTSFSSASNLSAGDFRLAVTAGDARLFWNNGDQPYWSMSSDARAVMNSNDAVSRLVMNASGLFLLASSGQVVWQATTLPPAPLRIGKLDFNGQLKISSYASPNSSSPSDVFLAPAGGCDLPLPCAALSLCSAGGQNSCSCPTGFVSGNGGCVPSDGSTLPSPSSSSSCRNGSNSDAAYLFLGRGIDYFGWKLSPPAAVGLELPACRSACTEKCSCLGFFIRNSSRSCFFLDKPLGSFRTGDDGTDDLELYLKVIPAAAGTSPAPIPGKRSLPTYILPILLPAVAVLLLLVLGGILLCRMRQRKRQERSRHSIKLGRFTSWPPTAPAEVTKDGGADDEDDDIYIPGLPARFSYEELQAATSGFKTRIGAGGFGEVFKGELPDGSAVAVKQISALGLRGKREFCAEIAAIGNIHHVNLVKLRGFCVQANKRLLVYEYMSRGSLDRSLFPGRGGAPAAPPLEWGERAEIALGAARGLAYLHAGCDHKIIHCDVKPENILLNHLGQVKIADFGMAKLLDQDQSAFFTTLRGTRGYLAPEWLTNSSITDRSDVYSFGMVLLELVRGRKNSDLASAAGSLAGGDTSGSAASGDSEYFPMRALEMHERGSYVELADPRLEGRVEAAEVEKVVRVALCCLHEEPVRRPTMAAVVGMLEGTTPLGTPRSESLNFLRLYARNLSPAHGDLPAAGFSCPVELTSSTQTTIAITMSTAISYLSAQQLSGPR